MSPALAGGFLTARLQGKPKRFFKFIFYSEILAVFSRRIHKNNFSSVQSLSHVQLFATPWTAAARQASLSITNSQSPPQPMSIESVMPSNHLILCRLLLFLPSIFPSIRVFSNESAFCIRWPKYWSFSFSISRSNEYSELVSFRIDWFDLLAVQGTPKSLLQHHSSKASILWQSLLSTLNKAHWPPFGAHFDLTHRLWLGCLTKPWFTILSYWTSNFDSCCLSFLTCNIERLIL